MVNYLIFTFKCTFLIILGLKILIGISCIVVTLWQCIQLLQNYTLKDTLQKTSDTTLGKTMTPMIIVCKDPPDNDTEKSIITKYDYDEDLSEAYWDAGNFSLVKMLTIFKVS